MNIIFLILGFVIGIFAFSQIVYPIAFSLPRASALKREGKLLKPIPLKSFFIAPIIWSAILFCIFWFVDTYFQRV